MHIILLAALTLIIIGVEDRESKRHLAVSVGITEKKEGAVQRKPTPDRLKSPLPEVDPVEVAAALLEPLTEQESKIIGELTETVGRKVIGIGGAFGARLGEAKANALRLGGGSGASESAVLRGLAWLARHQQTDGSWSFYRFPLRCKPGDRCAGSSDQRMKWADPSATALALLCFLGAGHTHTTGKYRKTVKRGLNYLLRIQHKSGRFGEVKGNFNYNQAICTLALAEAYGMSADPQIGLSAQRAVNFVENTQNSDGGWRYRPGESPSDSSVTGWQVMALKSALLAGLRVKKNSIQRALRWFDSVTDENGRTHYRKLGDRNSLGVSPALTAVALLCRLFAGAKPEDPAVQRAVQQILSFPPFWSDKPDNKTLPRMDAYYWYYATLALYMVGGEAWKKWNPQIRDLLVSKQRRKGCEAGSWDPVTLWSHLAGRMYITTISILMLEVYYRYLPLYRATEARDPLELAYGYALRAFERFLRSPSIYTAKSAEERIRSYLELVGDEHPERRRSLELKLALLYERTEQTGKVIELLKPDKFSGEARNTVLAFLARAYRKLSLSAEERRTATVYQRKSLELFAELALSAPNYTLLEAVASRAVAQEHFDIAESAYERLLLSYRKQRKFWDKAWKITAQLAKCYEALNKLQEAKKLYYELVRRYPESPTALSGLARISEKTGDLRNCLLSYRKLLNLSALNTELWWELKLKELKTRTCLNQKDAVRKELGLILLTRRHLIPRELVRQFEALYRSLRD